jgi:hypothetical protein
MTVSSGCIGGLLSDFVNFVILPWIHDAAKERAREKHAAQPLSDEYEDVLTYPGENEHEQQTET